MRVAKWSGVVFEFPPQTTKTKKISGAWPLGSCQMPPGADEAELHVVEEAAADQSELAAAVMELWHQADLDQHRAKQAAQVGTTVTANRYLSKQHK